MSEVILHDDDEAADKTAQFFMQLESFALPGVALPSEESAQPCVHTPSSEGKRSKRPKREGNDDAEASSSKVKAKKLRQDDEKTCFDANASSSKVKAKQYRQTDEKTCSDADASSSKVKAKKLRQADEKTCSDGHVVVEVLCPQCRRDNQSKRQMSLSESLRFGRTITKDAADDKLPEIIDLVADPVQPDPTVCRRCRRSLVVEHMSMGKKSASSKTSCAFSDRLKQYKRQAVETSAEWRLTDSEALAIMRDPCALCGARADPEAGRPNGITRLRAVEGIKGMGPYANGNVATACSSCNMMKGIHKMQAIVEICCSIATHRGLGDFGRFPERFRNNISRRSRSCYLGDTQRKGTGGTQASKTHSLSNADFNRIVALPCHYCGKQSDPPNHYNGLDRLDNSLRVYTETNSVSCCGTCNMAKGKMVENIFLEQCRIVAEFSAERYRGVQSFDPHDDVLDDIHSASATTMKSGNLLGSSKGDVLDASDVTHADDCTVRGSALETISELGFGEAS